MPLDFPNSPANGQIFTVGPRSWVYNSSIPAWEAKITTNHGLSHIDGSDDIPLATASSKGLASAAHITKLDGLPADALSPGDALTQLSSGAAPDGYVPVADGAGGIEWEVGGSGAPGTGTVTSVGVTGSQGISVVSGSPITAAGTIALGVDAGAMKSTLNIGNVNNTSDLNKPISIATQSALDGKVDEGAYIASLGGAPFNIATPEIGDVITYASNEWTNVRRETVTDGGNF